jgi:hypothetical protein
VDRKLETRTRLVNSINRKELVNTTVNFLGNGWMQIKLEAQDVRAEMKRITTNRLEER